jgi:Protein of unknown function (DUF1588)/Protein of unknown function (DUF1592)/Protein of unknown function (DUF1595)
MSIALSQLARGMRALTVAVLLANTTTQPAAAQAPSVDVEQKYQRADPNLYATARQYFPSNAIGSPNKRIFRLTRDQIDATVATLLPGYAPTSVKSMVARDALQTNYEYAELLSFSAANIGGLAKWTAAIADRVRKNPDGVIKCPANDANSECHTMAARTFVIKAFRGDLSEDRISEYVSFFKTAVKTSGSARAIGDLVEVILNSPHFLFRKELDVSRTLRLSPAQLLEAVTYTLADAPPDALGLSSADTTQYLRTGSEASTTIAAIMSTTAAREKLVRFFLAWLEIKEPGEFTISPQLYPAFTPKLEGALRDDSIQFLRTRLSQPTPRLQDITQATQSFVSPASAPIYGLRPSDSGTQALSNLNPNQRLGIFSHPSLIASHSGPTDTRPIKRGVFWVRKVMCMEMEPPPKDLHAKLYDLVGATERQRIEQSTSGPACLGCHKIINPFAFFQENYDAIGRWRTQENGSPIDASTLINFLDEEPIKTDGPVAALNVLTNSMMFQQCFVRQLFRFYMGRTEEPADDPLLRQVFFEFAYKSNQDIVRAVQMIASSDRIVRRQ